jgi:hypothetical protein
LQPALKLIRQLPDVELSRIAKTSHAPWVSRPYAKGVLPKTFAEPQG